MEAMGRFRKLGSEIFLVDKMIEKESEEYETKLGRLKANRQELKSERFKLEDEVGELPVEEWLPHMAPELRPEIILVREEGARIILMRSPHLPEFAFMTWSQMSSGTQWRIHLRLSDGSDSRSFCLCCACCSIETRGFEDLPEEKEDLKNVRARLRKSLRDKLEKACRANGIHTIFMRHAERWDESFGELNGVRVLEGGRYRRHLKKFFPDEEIRKAMAFIANPNLE